MISMFSKYKFDAVNQRVLGSSPRGGAYWSTTYD